MPFGSHRVCKWEDIMRYHGRALHVNRSGVRWILELPPSHAKGSSLIPFALSRFLPKPGWHPCAYFTGTAYAFLLQSSILQRSLRWCCNCFTGGSACNANPEHSVTIQLQHGYVSASGADTHMPFSCSLCPWGALEGTFKCRCPDVNVIRILYTLQPHTYTHRCRYRFLLEHPHLRGFLSGAAAFSRARRLHIFVCRLACRSDPT